MEYLDKRETIYKKIYQIKDRDKKQYIIYPFGKMGVLTKKILNEEFGIEEKYIVDNYLSSAGG